MSDNFKCLSDLLVLLNFSCFLELAISLSFTHLLPYRCFFVGVEDRNNSYPSIVREYEAIMVNVMSLITKEK